MSDRALPLYDEIPPEGFGGGADEPPVATQPMPKAALALEPTPAPAAPAEQPYAYPYLGNRAIPTAAPAPVQAPQPTAAPVGQPAPATPPPVVPGRGRGTLSPIPTDERRVRAENFWQTEGGVPRHVAEGIADRINAESSFNLTAPGAAGEVGLYQHHMDRKAKLVSQPGWDKDDTVQHRFALSEVTGGDAIATKHWNEIKNAKTREEAGMLWDRYFERSKNGPGSIGRSLSPQAVGKTIQSGNPDATLTLIRQTLPGERFSDTDRFAALEAWAVGRLLADGKPDEAEKMQDAITRVSHAGVNSHMMEAMAALKRGDIQGAARHLDISYAFAPDGASGKFFTDGKGKLYAQTVDEKTGTPLDKPFEVTEDAIANQLKFTKNPVTYLKTLGERQKQVAEARRADEQAAYYRDRNKTTLQVAQGAVAGAQTRQGMANDAALHRAFLNNETRLLTSGINTKDPQTVEQMMSGIGKELETLTPTLPETMAAGTPEHQIWRGRTADVALNIMANARGTITPQQATHLASQINIGKYQLRKLQNSNDYGVVDPSNPNLPPLATVSAETASKLPANVVKQ